jgi:hypothetical protein
MGGSSQELLFWVACVVILSENEVYILRPLVLLIRMEC